MESLGRRILLLAGFGLCCGSCAVLTLALNLQVCSWCILLLVLLVYFGVGVGGLSVPKCLPKMNPGRAMMLLCGCFSQPIVFMPLLHPLVGSKDGIQSMCSMAWHVSLGIAGNRG